MKAIEATVKAKLAAKPGLEDAGELWTRLCAAYAESGAEGAARMLDELREEGAGQGVDADEEGEEGAERRRR